MFKIATRALMKGSCTRFLPRVLSHALFNTLNSVTSPSSVSSTTSCRRCLLPPWGERDSRGSKQLAHASRSKTLGAPHATATVFLVGNRPRGAARTGLKWLALHSLRAKASEQDSFPFVNRCPALPAVDNLPGPSPGHREKKEINSRCLHPLCCPQLVFHNLLHLSRMMRHIHTKPALFSRAVRWVATVHKHRTPCRHSGCYSGSTNRTESSNYTTEWRQEGNAPPWNNFNFRLLK